MTNTAIRESDPIIPYADVASIPDAVRAPLDAYVKRMGFLPNALKLYLHRPEILECLIRLNNVTMRDESSHLDRELKRKVSIVCSALNHSAYCVAHNAATLKNSADGGGEGWNYTDEDVARILDPDHEDVDQAEAACLDYARAASMDASEVPQEIVVRLSEVLTPPQVVELACVVGFWKMYNTIHESLYIPLEDALIDADGVNEDETLAEKTVSRNDVEVRARVEIYSKRSCPFCRRAKRLLLSRGSTCIEYEVDQDDGRLQEMLTRTGGNRTVPQIFVNDELIGGMDQLLALDRVGELQSILGREASG